MAAVALQDFPVETIVLHFTHLRYGLTSCSRLPWVRTIASTAIVGWRLTRSSVCCTGGCTF